MRALGIDRDDAAVHLALLESTGRSARVLATWDVECPAGAFPADAVRASIAARASEPPEAVASALPGRAATHRILKLPFADASRIAATVPFELEGQVPLDLEGSLTTFAVLDRAPGSSRVLAALATHDAVSAHLSELREAGVDPAVIDLGGLATTGLIRLGAPDALVVEMRPGGAVAVLRDSRLEALHLLDGGAPEQMLGEIRWSAQALAPDRGLPPLVLAGGSVNGAASALAERLGVPLTPSTRALPAWAATSPPQALRAIALAARAAGLNSMGVNFRVGDLAYHAPSEETRKNFRIALALAGVAALLGVLSYGVQVRERNAELDSLRGDIRRSVTGIVPPTAEGQERIRLQGSVEELERRLILLGGSAGTRRSSLELLRTISSSIPERVPVEVSELAIDEDGVRFTARTDSYESVDVIKRALQGMPEVREPEVKDVKTAIDGRIEFRGSLGFPKEDRR